jgi:hypothetical protein
MTKDSSKYLEGFASGFSALAAFSAAVPEGACSACFDGDGTGGLEFWAGGTERGGVAGCWELALPISRQENNTVRRRSRIVKFVKEP